MACERRRRTDIVEDALAAALNRNLWAPLLLSISAMALLWIGTFGVTHPFLALFLTVVPLSAGAAALCGLATGLIAAAGAGFSGWYIILPPELSLRLNDWRDAYELVLICAIAGLTCLAVRADRTRPASTER